MQHKAETVKSTEPTAASITALAQHGHRLLPQK